MLKVALLGVDSGHFDVFANLISKEYKNQLEVSSIWGENFEQALEKTKLAELSERLIHNDLDLALVDIDVAMVLGRFADSHLKPALKCLSKKIPVFIDKPVANSRMELEEIKECSEICKTPFESFSIYRFSDVVQEAKTFMSDKQVSGFYLTGPRYCQDLGLDLRFSDIYFYGIHSVEILLEVMGDSISKIQKISTGRSVHSLFSFNCGAIGIINFASDLEDEFYFLHLVTDKGIFSHEIKYSQMLYSKAMDHLIDFFSSGLKRVPLESNLMSLKILDKMRAADNL